MATTEHSFEAEVPPKFLGTRIIVSELIKYRRLAI